LLEQQQQQHPVNDSDWADDFAITPRLAFGTSLAMLRAQLELLSEFFANKSFQSQFCCCFCF